MPEQPTGYAHAANLAGGDDLAVTLAGQLREARRTLARVRALHLKRDSDGWCTSCDEPWPCDTAAALDPPDGAA